MARWTATEEGTFFRAAQLDEGAVMRGPETNDRR